MRFGTISTQKLDELTARMTALEIREADLVERFVRGSGPGGQKVNKSSSCVYLLHKPSGIEVKCQRERSQALNRFFARRELCDRLEAQVKGVADARRQEIEKTRRRKRQKSRRQKRRMVADKRHRSGIKSTRGPVRDE
ncbi:MAG: peptide chain release factor-like protein [Kiritimatiellae bacterium]|nr:peptide chain release factor-like protein [Kiritimatiellia bacterium]